ncbi:MAG TPA: oligosaccharide flippase family protein [Candidatus Limnocylindria bacterium]|nr:oligosaccharide flippase family protein [Candidatus Limnocylindria bacterium]
MSPAALGRKSLLLSLGTWSGSALGMLVSILIARTLGPAALGTIGFSTGIVGLVAAALLPGFGQAHLKRLAEGQDPGRCLGTMLALQLTLHAGLAAVLLAGWSGGGPFHTREIGLVFLLMLAAQVASNFADIFLKVFLSREWIVSHFVIVQAARLARLGATVAVLGWAPSLPGVAATFVIEGTLGGLLAIVVLAARHRITLRAPTRESLLGYWRYARPFLVTTPLALFQDSIDRVLVGRWAGLEAAGYYQVARSLWEALSSVMAAPGLMFFTRLSSLYARRSAAGDREARDFFFGALDKLLFLAIPLAFVFWAVAGSLVGLLYGGAFEPAAPALRILVLAAVVANVINPYTLALYALEAGDRFVPVNILRVIAYLVVLVLMVPPDLAGFRGFWPGAPGAAVARLFLVLFPAWVYFRWTRELAGIPLYPRAWVYMAGFVLMLPAQHELARLLGWAAPGLGRFTEVAAAAVTLAAYLAFLRLAHPGTGDNLRYAWALLSPRSFVHFLRAGLRES